MLSLGEIGPYCCLAVLQGVLVILPRPAGSAVWGRLRSPGWALLLPGALLVGTFGVLAVPHGATGLAALAEVATPVLVGLAVLGVVRGPRRAWLVALPVLAAGAVGLHSWPAALSASLLTALGCLTLGAALVRLTPLPWPGAGIAAMCIVDDRDSPCSSSRAEPGGTRVARCEPLPAPRSARRCRAGRH